MHESGELDAWFQRYAAAARPSPSENMMTYQRYYETPCARICCWASRCAQIQCSQCRTILSCIPPAARYVCMECPLETKAERQKCPELCAACFANSLVLHEHTTWLLVDPLGHHSVAMRRVGLGVRQSLTSAHFPRISSWHPDSECAFCCSPFTADDPPVASPGCRTGSHGQGVLNQNQTAITIGGHPHLSCLQSFLAAKGLDSFCSVAAEEAGAGGDGVCPCFCDVCLHEQRCREFAVEFERGRACVSRAFSSATRSSDAGERECEGGARIAIADAENLFAELAVLLRIAPPSRAEWERLAASSSSSRAPSPSTYSGAIGVSVCLTVLADALKKLHPQRWLHPIIDTCCATKQI
eukprot:gnl/Spiro4/12498_TR6606_c0_g1_i1.p1 gnl/Spiro4/12498_TR6606_c0_g1~~gnl/Spiro4/12498_TR6606_c0_g1_i1.p1  ORF type:complete len:355 (+),score=42.72 gnl/Spiro4/12498_TR6606_c0_g1_i1:48-1112(+)